MNAVQLTNAEFSQRNVAEVFVRLISTDKALKDVYNKYIQDEYKDETESRLDYIDITEISRYLITCLGNGETGNFINFFDAVEYILENCDSYIEGLIVIGLFESLQNGCPSEYGSSACFDEWLRPVSRVNWQELIDFWNQKLSYRQKCSVKTVPEKSRFYNQK